VTRDGRDVAVASRRRTARMSPLTSEEIGAPGGTRTHDLQVRNLTLYPLSYGRTRRREVSEGEIWRRGRDSNPRSRLPHLTV
jgi:hypothetical protein